MNNSITRERLQEIAEDGFLKHGESKALARMVLAAMGSEPVATLDVQSRRPDGNKFALVFSSAAHKLPDDVYFLYRHAQPAPVVPEGLNPETTDLVLRFASALADKLYKAEQKYGRSTDWMKDDWYGDCLQSLLEHIEKGDPKDVAAYCAFMWHHGWKTKVAQPAQEKQKSISDRKAIFALESAGAVTPIGRAYKMELNACRAAMLAADPQSPGSEPATVPGKWIPVSERMPDENAEQQVLACFKGGDISALYYSDGRWDDAYGIVPIRQDVTHWMPMPAAPQEDINALIPLVSRNEQEVK
ncbi:DUF551 domain-containing protein [Klebsiella quasipneumoniae subsp. quasipneumoniae]|nr:DUF551 domain-containing protein [Klebsiella quasipneumoniae subsp. quasipneumoniae]